MAAHSSILAWESPWTEESGGLQSVGLQRVGHELVTKITTTLSMYTIPFSLSPFIQLNITILFTILPPFLSLSLSLRHLFIFKHILRVKK